MEQDQLVALAEKASNGDTGAFEAICRYKAKDVLYICTQLMGNLPDGEDAAQEVFVAMQTGILRLRDPQAFPAWCNRLIANTCKRMQRPNRRRGVSLEMLAQELTEVNMDFLPQEFAEQSEKRLIVLDSLRALPHKYRTVLVLFYYENQSIKEVAEGLGISYKSARNLVERGRKSLKKEIMLRTGETLDSHESQPSVSTLGGGLVLTRILKIDCLQAIPAENIDRLAEFGAAGAGTLAVAGSVAAAGIAPQVIGWVAAGATSVAAALAIAIGTSTVPSVSPQSPSVAVPPTATEQPTGEANGPAVAEISPQDEAPAPENGSPPGLPQPFAISRGVEGGGNVTSDFSLLQGTSSGAQSDFSSVTPASTKSTYTGSFQFIGVHGANPTYNGAAQGFEVTVYRNDVLVTVATANEEGSFTFELPNIGGVLTAQVEPRYGYGPIAPGDFTLTFSPNNTLLPAIPFTDTLSPTAMVCFYAADGSLMAGDVNPACARITAYDATETTISWQVEDRTGAVVQNGNSSLVPFTSLGGIAGEAEYVLRCTLTDSAGNTAEVEREFLVINTG